MKILGVIPARWASTRFPGKPLALIHGKPMIQWVIEGARTSTKLNEVIVATDDERIVQACKAIGCEAVMTDPNLASGTDRIYKASLGKKAEFIINIQGDEPLINQYWIDPLADVFLAEPFLEMATLAHPLSEDDLNNLNAVKVIVNQYFEAIYFSRFPIPYSRLNAKDLQMKAPSYKHIGMYGFRSDFLQRFCETPVSAIEKAEALEQLRALDLGIAMRVIFVEKPTLGVDTPEDIKKVEKCLEDGSWATK